MSFEVACNYDPGIPDLQPRSAASSVVQLDTIVNKSPFVTTEPVLAMVNAALLMEAVPEHTDDVNGI